MGRPVVPDHGANCTDLSSLMQDIFCTGCGRDKYIKERLINLAFSKVMSYTAPSFAITVRK